MTVEMSRQEIDTLLREAGAGVLSLGEGAETYAVPESFGYDGEALYFQLVSDGDSTKMAFVEATQIATFTVFTQSPAKSVVVRGRLQPVSDADRPQAGSSIADNAHIPTLSVIPDTPSDELSMTLYRLAPDEISGRDFTGSEHDVFSV